MKFTREVKTGILAICAIALLIFGYSFLKGKNLLENDRTLYAVYKNVEGLIPSSPVTINGLVVGQVVSIDFADTEGNLVVEFTVGNDFSFSKNSEAKVYGGGLIGGKSLAIMPKYEKGLEAKDRDTLPGRVEAGLLELVNDKLAPLQEKLEAAITDADTLLTSVNGILNVDNKNNLNTIFKDLSESVKDFKGTSRRLNNLMIANEDKLSNAFRNADEISTKLNKVSDSLSNINIGKIGKELEAVLVNFDKISQDLKSGKGTAGKLLKDDKLYDNLEKTSKQLELLLQDLRLNPKRYVHISVFGKKNAPYEKPTDSIN
ncbi:MCE family protein [Aquimarina sp. AD10]|uniref:ABC transporter substrate-binding protein n=1 Tax=Aquimarina aggregata TaxID=1642818 RepID=A0A163C136_9FLAO|nr:MULTISPECIES: MlaD family protein [Aquimarina]AXT60048.1 MCE family protein [Aquimarina sp. AD10]KZS41962.1 ABC transporter substrate-binding protein [Aquimarina aggregata]RKM96190.1 MCE family protein [Aquimarina sp. AD10]